MKGTCICFCVFSFIIAVWFLVIFFISVWAFINTQSVHHILEDIVITNINVSNYSSSAAGSQGTINSASLTFKIWSRNANKRMGVSIWHLRIAVVYNGYELGRAYGPRFVQPPRNISHLEAPLLLSNQTLPLDIATKLRADVETGEIPLRIFVKVRAKFKRVDQAWQTKLIGGDLGVDDKCRFIVNLNSTIGSSSLKGKSCGWTVSLYTSD